MDPIIDHFHIKYLHVDPRALQSIIVEQFWILSDIVLYINDSRFQKIPL